MAYYLNWNTVPNATQYKVAYAATATGAKTELTASPFVTNKADLTEIAAVGTKYLFVQAMGTGYTDSDWSAPFEFALYELYINNDYCTVSNTDRPILKGTPYTATVTPDSGYSITDGDITVTMGGVDITSTAVSGNTISIPSVTGTLSITAEATPAIATITTVFTNVTSSNPAVSVAYGQPYTTTLAGIPPYILNDETVRIVMGGVDITSGSYSEGSVYIGQVTGDIEIVASAGMVQLNTPTAPNAHSTASGLKLFWTGDVRATSYTVATATDPLGTKTTLGTVSTTSIGIASVPYGRYLFIKASGEGYTDSEWSNAYELLTYSITINKDEDVTLTLISNNETVPSPYRIVEDDDLIITATVQSAGGGILSPNSTVTSAGTTYHFNAQDTVTIAHVVDDVIVNAYVGYEAMPEPENILVGVGSIDYGFLYSAQWDAVTPPITATPQYEVAWSATPAGVKNTIITTVLPEAELLWDGITSGTYYIWVRTKGIYDYTDSAWAGGIAYSLYGIDTDADVAVTIRDDDVPALPLTLSTVIMAGHPMTVEAHPTSPLVIDPSLSYVGISGEESTRPFVNNTVTVAAVTGNVEIRAYAMAQPLAAPVITKTGTTISWDSVENATEYYVKDGNTTIATVPEQSGYEVSMTVGNGHFESNVKDGDESISTITGPYPHIYTIRNGEISFDCSGAASNISTTGGVEETAYGTGFHLLFAVTGDGTIYWDSNDPS